MKKEELNRLLEKYYNGDSTDGEERSLKRFFSENTNVEGYEYEKEIFGYFTTAGEVPEPSADFEARIIAGVGASDSRVTTRTNMKFILPVLSAAAGILILTGSYFFFINSKMPEDTFSDPELAYAETMKILMEVSTKLNNGTRALVPIDKINEHTNESFKAFSRSTKIIEKNLRSLDYLNSDHESSRLTGANIK
jgi:hypothetical protein